MKQKFEMILVGAVIILLLASGSFFLSSILEQPADAASRMTYAGQVNEVGPWAMQYVASTYVTGNTVTPASLTLNTKTESYMVQAIADDVYMSFWGTANSTDSLKLVQDTWYTMTNTKAKNAVTGTTGGDLSFLAVTTNNARIKVIELQAWGRRPNLSE